MSRILVVDDEPATRKLLTRALTRDNHDVRAVSDGVQAIAVIEDYQPDAVLLDVTMPEMDGLALCRHLRRSFRTRGLPVLLVTARGSSADRIQGFNAGADDYILKPFDLDELRARLDGALKRRRWDVSTNPLTGLPGSPAIHEEVTRRIGTGMPWAFAYLDIDSFKAYNDVYGYEAGDVIIRATGNLLVERAPSTLKDGLFPGHIGGDDFVVVGSIEDMRATLPKIIDDFDTLRLSHYGQSHLQAKGVTTTDRQGRSQFFPLMALSVAVVSNEKRRIRHYVRVVEIASELKHYVKRQEHHGKSILMWDRRSDPDEEKKSQ